MKPNAINVVSQVQPKGVLVANKYSIALKSAKRRTGQYTNKHASKKFKLVLIQSKYYHQLLLMQVKRKPSWKWLLHLKRLRRCKRKLRHRKVIRLRLVAQMLWVIKIKSFKRRSLIQKIILSLTVLLLKNNEIWWEPWLKSFGQCVVVTKVKLVISRKTIWENSSLYYLEGQKSLIVSWMKDLHHLIRMLKATSVRTT